jgi:hypothetical protein
VQGLLWYSYLTGDPEGMDGALGIADWSLSHLGIHTNGLERMLGHALMTLNDVYEATGEERYLRGSAHLVDQAFKWEHPVRSGFLAPIHESPAYFSGAPFNNGILSAGLIKFNEWAGLRELDALLVRFANWTLTDGWYAPGGLANKGGSPRSGGSAQHIGVQGRLMARAYALTHDPLFLAVPAELAAKGFAPTAKPIPGTRSTGLIFNHLPWLLGSLHANGNPQPEPQLEVVAPPPAALTLAPGARSVVSVTIKNTGAQAIEDFRVSLHARRDFALETLRAPPAWLGPGETAECQYAIPAPAQVNLTCNYNRVAWVQWSAVYRRDAQAHYSHQALKVVLAEPGTKPAGKTAQ